MSAFHPTRTFASARLRHLDRQSELLELRSDLGGVADDNPDETVGVDRSAQRGVERGASLGAIFTGNNARSVTVRSAKE